MFDGLWLVHPDGDMCEAFTKRFSGLPNVKVLKCRFEGLEPHDCFVTAGNAFGIMTAGIDAAIVGRFGESFMQRVQHHIMNEYYGEQPVGSAFIISTEDSTLPYICHAPTMRVPGSIAGTDKVYSATWAAWLAILHHNRTSSNRIGTVAMPAMGTGFGGMTYDEAARQMAAAYRHLLEPPHRLNWEFVVQRHKAICYDNGQQMVR